MILSIESSCDDSSIAITEIESKKLIFHKKISQEREHSIYGGVVPELASRLHAVALPKILEETKEFFPKLKAIAVTNEPGLSVTLMEGVMMAKALSLSLNLPLIGINHLIGHIYSLFIEKEAVLPKTVLLVSGGHTMILEVEDYEIVRVEAKTLDDSFGESFDKVAKMLNLGYPGGPIIEEYAKKGDSNRFDFPIPLKNSSKIAFSFSGLKNAVRLKIEELKTLSEQDKYDIAASFQKAAISHLLQKTKRVFDIFKPKDFAIVGGASANLALRKAFENECKKRKINIEFADLKFCSDNAAMIGRAAIEAYKLNKFSDPLALKANPRSTIF
ncbi:tRNA (adenosine(37)-N6)-threonylcarbamoyltransferase complex transferase subunit TsaD [Nitrosophilus kaiyonis]|uniref:tRNA (adenosine(37)-N6)-threonylcarbamoyltransferase complex transferase subunit TsaD n=1 Tax=Nitrosophilus kaiyonis TaxID=2930200 RepID=UPI00249173F4|nr:tRNA (adenosine(37)-N6)-threonylcarbamoyltransferase complex transferase subunit TsaD [Nitrosophilus kaiyonis]